MCKVKTHKSIAWLKTSHKHCHIGLCSRMRLYIGILSTKYLAKPVNGQLFNMVNNLATTVLPLARVTFRILVCTDRTHSLNDLVTHIILRSNQFQAGRLPLFLFLNQGEDLYILSHN